MEEVILKNGNMEIIGEPKHALDIVREHLGEDLYKYFSEIVETAETSTFDFDELAERHEKREEMLEGLILDMEVSFSEFDKYVFDIEDAESQIKKMKEAFEKAAKVARGIQKI